MPEFLIRDTAGWTRYGDFSARLSSCRIGRLCSGTISIVGQVAAFFIFLFGLHVALDLLHVLRDLGVSRPLPRRLAPHTRRLWRSFEGAETELAFEFADLEGVEPVLLAR